MSVVRNGDYFGSLIFQVGLQMICYLAVTT